MRKAVQLRYRKLRTAKKCAVVVFCVLWLLVSGSETAMDVHRLSAPSSHYQEKVCYAIPHSCGTVDIGQTDRLVNEQLREPEASKEIHCVRTSGSSST